MDALRSGVFLLCVLLPVCSAETFFTHPHICYFLDAFLTLYCIIATGLFFREKFAALSLTDEGPKGDKACIYQELDRARDTDAYDVLQSSKGKKKKAAKKNKSESTQGVPDKDPYESPVDSAALES
ncbi:T-cell surface glycoprotein CD3 zeta chain [Dissostichus eleginoides]|uniref:T-cell surface glycoprotein CD3 zeta chain n=1 Tax=Dissostichus eleginoides TaxID=100907 RepID=A0AAD9CLR9_DISEL|nr:T-cell surface glycoprotein CD3 zeta chain [Dissostichus eleginoides]